MNKDKEFDYYSSSVKNSEFYEAVEREKEILLTENTSLQERVNNECRNNQFSSNAKRY